MKLTWKLTCFSLMTLLAGFVTVQAEEDMEPLPLELPKPEFTGTPKDVRLPNLEKATGKKREPFLAPKGAVNLAAEKEVSGSDEWPVIGELEYITDGDKSGADGSFVELGPGLQWVQIDLGAEAEMYAIVFWHYHSQARAYIDTIVQVSNDPEFGDATMVFNSDHDNSAELGAGKDLAYIDNYEGKLVDAKGVKGRYVRLYSNGNTSNELNHYIEVEVWGKSAE